MYQPLQKKTSSWTPPTAQTKSKSPSKLGHFSIPPQPDNQTSPPPQAVRKYSRESADRLAANVMRSLEARDQQEAERSTMSPDSASTRISIADIASQRIPTPPMVSPDSAPTRISIADIASQRIPTLTPHTLTPCQRQLTLRQAREQNEQQAETLVAKVVAPINAPTSEEIAPGYKVSKAKSETLYALDQTLRPPGGDPCFDILELIEQIVDEMAFRYNDMLIDRHYLYDAKHQNLEAVRALERQGYGSWDGHKGRYNNLQKDLNALLKEWDDNNCDNNDVDYYQAYIIWDMAMEYSKKHPPTQPNRHKFELPDWAKEAGVFIRDGIVWIPVALGGILLELLKAILSAAGRRWATY